MRTKERKQITNEEFDSILMEIVNEQTAASLLSIPGVYELVSEDFNNAILALWDERNEQY